MLKNKIYNYITLELIKSFVLILFSLSLIAWTVRAVNFLDLIIESGYSTNIYFKFSLLNLFGIAPKFIPLSFLITLTLFILKHLQNSEIMMIIIIIIITLLRTIPTLGETTGRPEGLLGSSCRVYSGGGRPEGLLGSSSREKSRGRGT